MKSLNEIVYGINKRDLVSLLSEHTGIDHWTTRGYRIQPTSAHKKYGIVYRNATTGKTIPWKDIKITDSGHEVRISVPTVTDLHFKGERLELLLEDVFNLTS